MSEGVDHQRLWERYMQVERKELEDRENGELAKVLGPAMPGESQEELDRLSREDREKAEEGFVELRDGDEIWYKHIDELTREERHARIEAQRQRLFWIQERLKSLPDESPGPAHADDTVERTVTSGFSAGDRRPGLFGGRGRQMDRDWGVGG